MHFKKQKDKYMYIDKNRQNLLFDKVTQLLSKARSEVVRSINKTMVYTYFEIGRLIIEEEQHGKDRAEYGKSILKTLSDKLVKEIGKGFSVDNLENMRKFYLAYSKSETVSRNLECFSWFTKFNPTIYGFDLRYYTGGGEGGGRRKAEGNG